MQPVVRRDCIRNSKKKNTKNGHHASDQPGVGQYQPDRWQRIAFRIEIYTKNNEYTNPAFGHNCILGIEKIDRDVIDHICVVTPEILTIRQPYAGEERFAPIKPSRMLPTSHKCPKPCNIFGNAQMTKNLAKTQNTNKNAHARPRHIHLHNRVP